MKKKILLSALSVFSLMIAGKTFAQSYGGYNGQSYGAYGTGLHSHYDRYGHREAYVDFNVIREDREAVNYDLNSIEQKKQELQNDRYYNNRFEYRKDRRELAELHEKLAFDREKLERHMRRMHYDGGFGARF